MILEQEGEEVRGHPHAYMQEGSDQPVQDYLPRQVRLREQMRHHIQEAVPQGSLEALQASDGRKVPSDSQKVVSDRLREQVQEDSEQGLQDGLQEELQQSAAEGMQKCSGKIGVLHYSLSLEISTHILQFPYCGITRALKISSKSEMFSCGCNR